MIISVRGTSGSGKTHLARRLMDLCSGKKPLNHEGVKQEVGYDFVGSRPLRVIGRYNVASGGADRVSGRDFTFDLISSGAELSDVFYEGLLIGNEVSRTVMLNRKHPTHVLFLDTPLEQCLEAINSRRREKGNEEPVSLKKTTEKFAELERVRFRLRQAEVKTYKLNREDAFTKVRELLEI